MLWSVRPHQVSASRTGRKNQHAIMTTTTTTDQIKTGQHSTMQQLMKLAWWLIKQLCALTQVQLIATSMCCACSDFCTVLLCLPGPDQLCTLARNWWYKQQHINMLVGKENRHGRSIPFPQHLLVAQFCMLNLMAKHMHRWCASLHNTTTNLTEIWKLWCAYLCMINVVWLDAFVPVSTL